jgi:uncharacterized linocin/CFP29 family protein
MIIDDSQAIKEVLLEIVDNQLRALDPCETKETYDRLVLEGYSDSEVRGFLAAAVEMELTEMMKSMEPFDHERFVGILRQLPDILWLDEED